MLPTTSADAEPSDRRPERRGSAAAGWARVKGMAAGIVERRRQTPKGSGRVHVHVHVNVPEPWRSPSVLDPTLPLD